MTGPSGAPIGALGSILRRGAAMSAERVTSRAWPATVEAASAKAASGRGRLKAKGIGGSPSISIAAGAAQALGPRRS